MTATVVVGDCREVMATMDAESVDAVVCDPPYDLTGASRNGSPRQNNPATPFGRHNLQPAGGFMGAKWDGTGVAFDPATWEAVKRVMKPGAALLAFGGTRTWHRLAVAIEDAGFELRDTLVWMHGQGFPKGLDVERAVAVKTCRLPGRHFANQIPKEDERQPDDHVCPMTPESEPWDGWDVALKPSFEPIVLARKPLAGTVAANVAAYGTGALNIGATRIGLGGTPKTSGGCAGTTAMHGGGIVARAKEDNSLGRWPSNLILSHVSPDEHGEGGCREVGVRKVKTGTHIGRNIAGTEKNRHGRYNVGMPELGTDRGYADPDGFEEIAAWECSPECPIALLDEQSGILHSHPGTCRTDAAPGMYSPSRRAGTVVQAGSSGGASRFFLNVAPDEEATVWECSPECPIALLDEQSGERGGNLRDDGGPKFRGKTFAQDAYSLTMQSKGGGYGDTGGASRFFLNVAPDEEATRFLYSPKASRRERNAGLEGMPERVATVGNMDANTGRDPTNPKNAVGGKQARIERGEPPTRPAANNHPTVKPLALMRWLVKLVTPPGGKILDPFCGSGTTGCAAALEGFRFVGIEQDAEYAEIARKRIAYWAAQEQPQAPPVRRAKKTRPSAHDQPKPEQLGLLLDVAPVRMAAD